MKREVSGEVNGIKYNIDETIVTRLKEVHNVDALQEIEQALRQFKESERNKDEGKSS